METILRTQKDNANIGQKCLIFGADKIDISGLIYTTWVFHIFLSKVNRKSRSICEEKCFCFVDNDNIGRQCL